MDISNCQPGQFSDKLVRLESSCDGQVSVLASLVGILLFIQAFTCFQSFYRWVRKNSTGRWRFHGRARDEYCLRRRLPILPSLIAVVSASSILFWTLTLANVANFANGLSVIFFAIHIFVAYCMMHFHMLRFIRLGHRLRPVATQSGRDQHTDATDVDESDKSKNQTTSVEAHHVQILFRISIFASFMGLVLGIFGGSLATKEFWVVSACGVCFAVAALSLMLTFILQIHQIVVTVANFKLNALAQARLAEFDRMVLVLGRHRRIAVVVMLIMSIISLTLAFIPVRHWYLLYLADSVIVGHTLLIWVDELVFFRSRPSRTRTLSPSAPNSPRIGRHQRINSKQDSKLQVRDKKSIDKDPEAIQNLNRATPSPKSKVSPIIGNERLHPDNLLIVERQTLNQAPAT